MFKLSQQIKKTKKKQLQRFYTHYAQKFSNLRPLLSITLTTGFRNSKKFGHWILGSGDKKTVKGSEKLNTQKILLSKAKFALKISLFAAAIFTLYTLGFLDHLHLFCFDENYYSHLILKPWHFCSLLIYLRVAKPMWCDVASRTLKLVESLQTRQASPHKKHTLHWPAQPFFIW